MKERLPEARRAISKPGGRGGYAAVSTPTSALVSVPTLSSQVVSDKSPITDII